MTFGIDGLSSGLDTTAIINQLMQLERVPAVRMEQTRTSNTLAIGALGTIRTAIGAVADAARALGSATSTFVPRVATSSATHVTATAGPQAQQGTVTFTVDQLAARHAVVSEGLASARDAVVRSGGDGTVSITAGGTTHELTVADGTTLEQLVSQINGSDVGARASLVDTGSGIKLQLTSATGGAAGAFTVDLTALDAAALGGSTATQVLSQGTDARLTVGTGPGAYSVTSTTNTFTGLVEGLSLTVTAADPDQPVTVDVTDDTEALSGRVKTFVDRVNAALAAMDNQLRTAVGGATPGALAGNSAIRSLRDSLLSTVTFPVAGATAGSAGSIGIQSTREGTLTFDAARFAEAVAADPAAVEQLFRGADDAGLAGRVLDTVERATAANTGVLATVQSSKESQNRTLADSIASIDRRLELRRSTLMRQFSSLEVVLGRMQAQQSWMASQISQLNVNAPR